MTCFLPNQVSGAVPDTQSSKTVDKNSGQGEKFFPVDLFLHRLILFRTSGSGREMGSVIVVVNRNLIACIGGVFPHPPDGSRRIRLDFKIFYKFLTYTSGFRLKFLILTFFLMTPMLVINITKQLLFPGLIKALVVRNYCNLFNSVNRH